MILARKCQAIGKLLEQTYGTKKSSIGASITIKDSPLDMLASTKKKGPKKIENHSPKSDIYSPLNSLKRSGV